MKFLLSLLLLLLLAPEALAAPFCKVEVSSICETVVVKRKKLMTFGALIIKHRKNQQISDVAKRAGLKPETWIEIESGKREPRISTGIRMLKVLKVPIRELRSIK